MDTERPEGEVDPQAHAIRLLMGQVERLAARVAELERRSSVGDAPQARVDGSIATVPPQVLSSELEASPFGSPPTASPEDAPIDGPQPAWWQIGALSRVPVDRFPVVAMSVAGGLACLLGLLYFGWYSVTQGWFPAEIRLSITAGAGLLALLAAWRLAPPGQGSFASGLGGAGLGAWFGAIAFARHEHAFLSPTPTFVLLTAGAALGLVVASGRRLRALAALAALGAYLSPVVAGSGADRLHELMAYQLVMLGLVFVLEERHRWFELGYLGLVLTWGLMFGWAQAHLRAESAVDMLAWALALLLVAQGRSLALARCPAVDPLHPALRLLANGMVAWAAASMAGTALEGPAEVGGVMLAMAIVHAVAVVPLARVPSARPALRVCATLAWTEAFAFAPVRWDGDPVGAWWVGMIVLALVAHLRTGRWQFVLPLALPLTSLLAWAMVQSGTSRLAEPLGFFAAAVPWFLGLRPVGAERDPRHASWRTYALVFGLAAWQLAVWNLIDGRGHDAAITRVLAGQLPLAVTFACVLRWPSIRHERFLIGALFVQLAIQFGVMVSQDLHRPGSVVLEVRLQHLGAGASLAAIALAWILRRWRLREVHDEYGSSLPIDSAILTAALSVLLSARLGWAAIAVGKSLHHAGVSLLFGMTALGLLLLGLNHRRRRLVQLAFVGLALSVAKVVFFDLIEVGIAWRVLSFTGLGACLLAGAFAYRRLGDRLAAQGE